ncbi:MAG: hypothetical protein KA233_11905 [Novosphingobium sp.]|nr:hypothetical protein [Novosphingobium sp.]MBP6556372.1 hypothetical protein [Novosphingobium sp.]
MEQPPLFEFHLYRGRYRGRPVHPLGWLAMFGAILAPHLGWLLLIIEPGLPFWLPLIVAMATIGPAIWWLVRLARRRGLFLD